MRLLPEPANEPLSADEAVSQARAAWAEACRTQLAIAATTSSVARDLYEVKTVNYWTLRRFASDAREQARRAQRVAELIEGAVDAFEATEGRS